MSDYTFSDLVNAIKAQTEALKENTAMLKAFGSEAPKQAVEAPKAKDEAVEAPKAKDEGSDKINAVEAAILEVKAKFGNDEARKILKDITGSTSLKKIEPQHYDAILAACEEKSQKPIIEKGADADNDDDAPDFDALRVELDNKLIAFLKGAKNDDEESERKDAVRAIIKEQGKAPKKAEIADENLVATLNALDKLAERYAAADDDDI